MDFSQTHKRIIASARELFFARGPNSISIHQITAKIGISSKTLYEHFPSKESLIEAVIEWQNLEIRQSLDSILANGTDYVTKLHEFTLAVSTFLSSISTEFLHDLEIHYPALWHRMAEFRRETVQTRFSRLLQQGISLGFLRHDLNCALVVAAVLATIQSITRSEILISMNYSPSQAYTHIIHLFFRGILTDEARSILPASVPSRTIKGV